MVTLLLGDAHMTWRATSALLPLMTKSDLQYYIACHYIINTRIETKATTLETHVCCESSIRVQETVTLQRNEGTTNNESRKR